MARPAIIAGNHKYSGTDAHRTLLSIGSLWLHHFHDVKRDPHCVKSVGEELARQLESLINERNPETEIAKNLNH